MARSAKWGTLRQGAEAGSVDKGAENPASSAPPRETEAPRGTGDLSYIPLLPLKNGIPNQRFPRFSQRGVFNFPWSLKRS